MMKKILLFVFLFPVCAGNAQFPNKNQSEIGFFNKSTRHENRLHERSKIGYYLKPDNRYIEGTVKKISRDTVFINDTLFRIGDVNLIVNSIFVGKENIKDPQTYDGSGILYRNDTTLWKAFYYPAESSIFQGPWNKPYLDYRAQQAKENRKKNFIPFKDNYLLINLIRFIGLDLAVSYERKLSKSVSLGMELGYKLGVGQGPYSMAFPYSQSGPSLIIGPKLYLHQKFYLSALIHLKYLEIRDGYYREMFTDGYSVYMDQYEFLWGGSLRVGVMAHAGNCWFDFYLGAGVKYISAHEIWFRSYNDGDHYYHPPLVQDVYYLKPILNMGLKIGLGLL